MGRQSALDRRKRREDREHLARPLVARYYAAERVSHAGVTDMANDQMMAQMSKKGGFIAALDQSGGSSPGALRLYGIPDTAYSGDAEMFRAIHQMRVRIMTSPSFTGDKVVGAILFEGTMDGEVRGKPTASYLWEERRVVPFVKVDRGLEPEKDGVQLMRLMPQLDQLCERAVRLGVFGTKMRSVINLASRDGIAANAAQQFEFGDQIAKHGLMPILEPEVSIKSPDKKGAEAILLDELKKRTDALPAGRQIMFKLTLPDVADLYAPLVNHPRVARVVALSGGYTRADACQRLAANHGMIASFSRALCQDLRVSMSDAEFAAALAQSIDEIHRASTVKT
jgi:fructose-bisphosphate aldolase, class I